MGRFVNPDNSAFQVALNSDIYVDKSGLLEYLNGAMNTDRALICNSRPRGLENQSPLICLPHITAKAVIQRKCLKSWK